MRNILFLFTLTLILYTPPLLAVESKNDTLSEDCMISYREIREELYQLKSCKQDSDCAPVFFTFPFGPDKCIFYGIETTTGKKTQKIVEERISEFTNECSKDKSDYQAWLAKQSDGFKMSPQDCITGKVFANCDDGHCVTKFAYEYKSEEKVKLNVK